MALTAGSIIDRAARTLNDSDHEHWTVAELLEYLSDAQRAAVLVRSEVNPRTRIVPVSAGTKQELPDDGFVLIEVVRNIGPAPDNIPGDVISPISRGDIDQSTPGWHKEGFDDEASNFIYDIRNRKTFWIYPGARAGTDKQIEIVYAAVPPELTAADDNARKALPIGIDDIYEPALLAYVLYRAKSKEIASDQVGEAEASTYYEKFLTLLLGRDESDIEITLGGSQNEVKEK